MVVVDDPGPTFGFSAPPRKGERRLLLLRTRITSAIERYWPRFQGPVGLAICAFVLVKTWPPTLANIGLAISFSLLWFAVVSFFSNRCRLNTIEVPDSLKKSGISGASMTREIVSSARELLYSTQMHGVLTSIDLPPSSHDKLPGLGITISQLRLFIWEICGRLPQIIEGEVFEAAEQRRYMVKFSIPKEGRSNEMGPLPLEKMASVGLPCAHRMIRLAAPFQAAWLALNDGEIDTAASIAHEAAQHKNVTSSQRALCWCFVALLRIMRDDSVGSARALSEADKLEKNHPIICSLIYHLISSSDGEGLSPEARQLRRDVRNWHYEVGKAGRAYLSKIDVFFSFYSSLSALRRSRETTLQRLRRRLAEASAQVEAAIANPSDAFFLIHDVWEARAVAEDVLQHLTGGGKPDGRDSQTYLVEYEGAAREARKLVEYLLSNEQQIANLQVLAEEYRLELERESKDHLASEADARLLQKIEEVAEKFQTAAASGKAQLDSLNELLKSQIKEMAQAVIAAETRRSEWAALEATPFGPSRDAQPHATKKEA